MTFDLRITTNENAGNYFNQAKKLKSKLDGIKETISKYESKKEQVAKKEFAQKKSFEEELERKQRKKEWFEKYHWFYTSKNNLCVGGRDASTNEQVIKIHTDKTDLVFHTDMAGSPFFVLKRSSEDIDAQELFEVASITACYSKAWKKGFSQTDVFYVNPDQVSKEAQSGESLTKGSFMIRGKTNYSSHEMKLSISIDDKERVCIGHSRQFEKNGQSYATVVQGTEKSSDLAKKLQKFFGKGLLDEFVKVIPAGGAKVILHKNKDL